MGRRPTFRSLLILPPAWIADTYNLNPSDPFEVVGGTSLSAPAWAGLFALVNEGRVAAGDSTLNSSTPTDAQTSLYMLSQNDYNVISSGCNGYTAGAGYNLVTGLGTPVANLLVSDLVAYQTGTFVASGPTVGPLQNANLVNTGTNGSGTIDVFSVFDSFTVAQAGWTRGGAAAAIGSAKATGPVRKPPVSANKVITAVDRAVVVIVDETSPETFIGDLAFEQVSSGTHKAPRGWSVLKSLFVE